MRVLPMVGTGALVIVLAGNHVSGAMQEPGGPARVSIRHTDVSIDTMVEGDGPAIVLIPSLARGSEDYGEVSAGLAHAGYRVLRPQPRGIGGSVGPLAKVTLHDFARDIAEVIRHSGGGRAVVVGHAYGNWVARMTATDYPDLVRGVVIAAAAAREYDRGLSTDVTKAGDPTLPDADRLAALQRAFFAPGNDPKVWLGGWHPEVRERQRAAAAAVPRSAWWSAGRAPILEMQGEYDPFKPPNTRRELTDELGSRVTVVVIRNASHALFPEQPRAAVEALRRWISGLL
mgnify:CR=1 FL=1